MSEDLTRTKFLNSPFSSDGPLSELEKEFFLCELWPVPSDRKETANRGGFDSFFELLEYEMRSRGPDGHIHSITKIDDLFFLIKTIRSNASSEWEHIVTTIQNCRPDLAPSYTSLRTAIELAVRLWLMVEIVRCPDLPHPYGISFRRIPWIRNSSLLSVLADHFNRHQCDQTAEFSEKFNLYDMKRIGGFKVHWTNNLACHLAIRGPYIVVFHEVSVLKRMLESGSTFPFFEPEFIRETIDTIELLLPCTNSSCNDWLADEIKRHRLDQNLIQHDLFTSGRITPITRKARYPYWQENLVALEDAFEKSKPRNFQQWWHDTRDMQQWWGFWLIITGLFLTVLFGLIQSITGIIQVVKSSK